MLRLAAFALAVCCGSLAAGQEAPPAAPPVQPRPTAPSVPGGERVAPDGGLGGTPTRVPELLARTPDVARVSSLIGAEILDAGCQDVGRLDDLVARKDGGLIAILTRPDGRRIGLPLAELIARAKPDLEGGSERVTIRSFKLTRESRPLEVAPEVEDKSKLDEAWLAQLDTGSRPAPGAPKPDKPDAAPGEPAAPVTPAEGEAPLPPPAPARLPLLGALLGRTALDPAGKPIGTIVDVVVGIPKSQVAYLVVAQSEAPDAPDAFHAVPFEALGPITEDEGVRLTLGAAELQATPRLDGLTRLPVDPLATAAPKPPTPAR